jgi:hypothetical protein
MVENIPKNNSAEVFPDKNFLAKSGGGASDGQ